MPRFSDPSRAGDALGGVGLGVDIDHARQLAAIVENSFDAIIGQDLQGRVTSWNPAAERIFGYGAHEMIGRRVDRLVPGDRRAERTALIERVFRGERVEQHETVRLTKDGRIIDVSLTISPIRDPDGSVVGVSGIARDITERRRIEAQLQYLADHDALTGLVNRGRFGEELERVIAYAARYGEPAALLVIDLDNFKYFNDTHGHRAGDTLIRAVASTLRRRMRTTDTLARLGGDEFAVLLARVDAGQARSVALDLLGAVRECLPGTPVTASIGIAAFDDEVSAEDLLSRADLAMYEVKDRGRDGIAVYSTAGHQRLTHRVSWEDRIRRALSEDAFTLDFQPIVDLTSGRIVQGELLLRMRGDHGEPIAPSAFLGVAERSGLIAEIDRWVVRRAIAAMADPRHAMLTPRVEINLSQVSIDDPELPDFIEEQLAIARVEPSRLIFEITETAAVANMEDAARFAERLRAAGCGFALDDFGTGFGSFYYLKHLPIDYVKIDGDFIRELPDAPTDQLMVQAMVKVSKGLDMKTIAEWVTDDATVTLLRSYGIDLAQGFHLGRPRPLPRTTPSS